MEVAEGDDREEIEHLGKGIAGFGIVIGHRCYRLDFDGIALY